MAAYIASGRTSLDVGGAVIGRPQAQPVAVLAPAAGSTPRADDATGGMTVGELARAWLADIEATRPNCRRTSLWHGAIAASRAIRPFAALPVAAFGSRALVEVQRHLGRTKVPTGKAGADGSPPPMKRLSQRYINDVARVSRGESLPAAEADELPRVMGAQRIPDHAFRRDVRATAGADTATGYRRLELTWNHPHLFDEPAAWVDQHVRTIVARRGARPWPR